MQAVARHKQVLVGLGLDTPDGELTDVLMFDSADPLLGTGPVVIHDFSRRNDANDFFPFASCVMITASAWFLHNDWGAAMVHGEWEAT